MRYIYTFGDFYDEAMALNAGNKCPADMVHFIVREEAEVVNFDYLDCKGMRRYLALPSLLCKMIFTPSKGSDVVFIYPYRSNHPTVIKALKLAAPFLHAKKVRLCAVVVDIDSIRFNDSDIYKYDIKPLNCFDHIVVHSEAMRAMLESYGLKTHASIIELIDYLVKFPGDEKRHLSHEVCFAGNLKKSAFLWNLNDFKQGKIHLYLYGGGYTEEINQDVASYEGKFLPDDLRGIKGSWGLVWDGDSFDGITGYLGRYLSYNSPHKASMYLCAGLPLIAPEGTHTADVVREHGLGLVVSSLNEIEGMIDSMTDDQYAQILENVNKYADRLMNGRNLLDALSS